MAVNVVYRNSTELTLTSFSCFSVAGFCFLVGLCLLLLA